MQHKYFPQKMKLGATGITSVQNPSYDFSQNTHPSGQRRNHGRRAAGRQNKMDSFRIYTQNAQRMQRLKPHLEDIHKVANGDGRLTGTVRQEMAELLLRVDRGKERAFLADLAAKDICLLAELRCACNVQLHRQANALGKVHRDANISEIYHAINAGLSGRIPKSDWRANAIYRGYERMVFEEGK